MVTYSRKSFSLLKGWVKFLSMDCLQVLGNSLLPEYWCYIQRTDIRGSHYNVNTEKKINLSPKREHLLENWIISEKKKKKKHMVLVINIFVLDSTHVKSYKWKNLFLLRNVICLMVVTLFLNKILHLHLFISYSHI